MNYFHLIFEKILDLLFPIQCLGCQKEGVFLCSECINKIQDFRFQPACPFCEEPNEDGSSCRKCASDHFLDGLSVAADYSNPIAAKAIKTYKFYLVRDLSRPLANLMIQNIETRFSVETQDLASLQKNNNFDLIIPVPLHKKRLKWRGFNQAELLAEKISEYFKIPLNRDCLARIKNTPPQSKAKNQEEREENIKGAFFVIGNSLPLLISPSGRGRNILLIDDVCSTASTLDECAKVLKNSGAGKVWGCVIARGR